MSSINISGYNTQFQNFVNFANERVKAGKDDAIALVEEGSTSLGVRSIKAASSDRAGHFAASFFRTNASKSANDVARDIFKRAISDMFGGENRIPDIVRDTMKMEDFGQGKPLTARRILAVKSAIDILGGGLFERTSSVNEAKAMGYLDSELPKLARVANLYKQATGCDDGTAEAAALDPASKARKLFDAGGRFTMNAENFKRGLELMDSFKTYFTGLRECYKNGKPADTPTKFNVHPEAVTTKDYVHGVEKFIFDELAVNTTIDLNAADPEDIFGVRNNPATRFVIRGFTRGQGSTIAQIPPEKRQLLYEANDLFNPLAMDSQDKPGRVEQFTIFTARVVKHFDELAAFKAAGKFTRESVFDLLYPDSEKKGAKDAAAIDALVDALYEKVSEDSALFIKGSMMLAKSGGTLDEVVEALNENRELDAAPYVTPSNGDLDDMDGTGEGGIKSMCADIYRPSLPTFGEPPKSVNCAEDFVFHFEDETLTCGGSSKEKAKPTMDKISDKLRALCTRAHPGQLDSLGRALDQGQLGRLKALQKFGYNANEHMPVDYTISKNRDTGVITVRIKEPEGFPIKFNWSVTIGINGETTATPMRLDHGQYEDEAMKSLETLTAKMPGKDEASARTFIKETLEACGDDFDLKDIVSKNIYNVCVDGAAQLRTPDAIRKRIALLRSNLDEVRHAASGNAKIEAAGIRCITGLNGKPAPVNLVRKLVDTASRTPVPEAFAKLNANSSSADILRAAGAMRTAVGEVLRDANPGASLEGADDLLPVMELAVSVLLLNLSRKQAEGIHAAFRSENAGKLDAMLQKISSNFNLVSRFEDALQPAIMGQAFSMGGQITLYRETLENIHALPKATVPQATGSVDKRAFSEVFEVVLDFANTQIAEQMNLDNAQGV